MRHENVTFLSADGHPLSARLDLPVDADPVGYALFCHCFTCTKNLRAVGNITEALAKEGIATLRFDFTGLGGSGGDFSETTFATNIEDVVEAARFLEEDYEAPRLLIGHSLGGAAVLHAAPQIPSAHAIATIGAPADPAHIRQHLTGGIDEIEREGEAEVLLAGRPFRIKKAFLEALDATPTVEEAARVPGALLILHSPIDNTVGIDNASELFIAARHPKSFVSLDDADHLLSDDADSAYAGHVIAAWAERYLGVDQVRTKNAGERLDAEESVTVVRTGRTGFRTDVMANGFGLVADEPHSVGGTNLGPSPYDYLTTALGACTTMTLRMYADRKKWPLESVIVRLSHSKIHADDCAHCETETGKIDHIERTIEVEGDLDDDQRQRLLEIADRCPVHRTLHSEVVVHTELIAR